MMSRTALRRRLLRGVAAAISPVAAPSGPIRRIALFRPDHLGDLILAAPAIDRLRDALPNVAIDLYIGPWSEPIASAIPGVTPRVIEFPGFQRGPKPRGDKPYRLLWREARNVRHQHYDLAIVLRFDHWWGAALASLAGVPRIIGYTQPDVSPFLSHRLTYHGGRHETIQNCTLVDAAIRLAGGVVPATAPGRSALAFPNAVTPDLPDRYAVMHPGAGAPVKRWRADGFSQVARKLAEMGIGIVVTGGSAERALVDDLIAVLGVPAVRVVGEPIPVLAAVLRQALVAVGPDSGVMHLASAVGTPTVRLYGPVDWRTFGPWADPSSRVVASALPCAPCNRLDYPPDVLELHPCVRDLATDQVLSLVLQAVA